MEIDGPTHFSRNTSVGRNFREHSNKVMGFANGKANWEIRRVGTRPLQDSWSGDAHDAGVQLYDDCSVDWVTLTMPVSDGFVSSSFRDLSRTRGQAMLLMPMSTCMTIAVSMLLHMT
ncbi:hypothetical protein Fmac_026896 [Flemingia macrophylla]|uniref:Uncharacterized protein n=1 Tax=Flemingia macrophylla TaxID=520843 RepID=A0ABD1LGB7_9FABA